MESVRPDDPLTADSIPPSIETPTAKLVYLTLVVAGGLTVEELQDHTNETKLTLHGVLGALEGKELIERVDSAYYVTA